MARRGFTEQKSLLEIVSFVYSIVGVSIVDLMDFKLLTEIEPGLGEKPAHEELREFINKMFVSKLRTWCNAGVFQMDFFNEKKMADDSTLKEERIRIGPMPSGSDKAAATKAHAYEVKHGRILTERAGQHTIFISYRHIPERHVNFRKLTAWLLHRDSLNQLYCTFREAVWKMSRDISW